MGKYSRNKVIARYGPKASKSTFYLHLFVVMATNVNVVISKKKNFSQQSIFDHKLEYNYNEIESADADIRGI